MRVLSWNLFHGRDFPPTRPCSPGAHGCSSGPSATPPTRRSTARCCAEFAPGSRAATGTSRCSRRLRRAGSSRSPGARRRPGPSRSPRVTCCPPLRGWLADRNPDLIASNEGGSNLILVRPPGGSPRPHVAARPAAGAAAMLWPALELAARDGVCVANLHAAPVPGAAAAELVLRRRARDATGPATTRSCSAATSTCGRAAHPGALRRCCASASRWRRPPARARSTTCSRAGSTWSARGASRGRGARAHRARRTAGSGCPTTRLSSPVRPAIVPQRKRASDEEVVRMAERGSTASKSGRREHAIAQDRELEPGSKARGATPRAALARLEAEHRSRASSAAARGPQGRQGARAPAARREGRGARRRAPPRSRPRAGGRLGQDRRRAARGAARRT